MVRHFGGLRISPPLPTNIIRTIKDATEFDHSYAHKDETVGLLPDGSIGIIGEAFTVIRPEVADDSNGYEPDTGMNMVTSPSLLKALDDTLVAAAASGAINLSDYTVSGALYAEEEGQMSRLAADSVPLSQIGKLKPEQAKYSWSNGDVTNHRGERVTA
jgi:hypothetical protein